jgi:CMP-N,N'-diacetyllegionaminic acid synthase
MKVVAIIPARGGSKRIPRKNLAACAGQSLLAWTAQAALGSRLLFRTLLSTDDVEIAEAGKKLGLEVPYLRPVELAADTTPMLPVLQELIRNLALDDAKAIVLLQPSSPLRRSQHIDEAITLFIDRNAGSVVSVTTVPHQYNPVKVLTAETGELRQFMLSGYIPGSSDSAHLPKVVARNGPAIVVSRPSDILAGTLYGNPSLPYLMAHEDSIDIDEPADLVMADALLRARLK